MFVLRTNTERQHIKSGKCDIWRTFYPEDHKSIFGGCYGILSVFNEICLPPGEETAPQSIDNTELITYVYKGAVVQKDSTRLSTVIHAGEFQCTAINHIFCHSMANALKADLVHIFRIHLHLGFPKDVGPDYANKPMRFTSAQRRNVLCAIASPDGFKGSHRIHPDARIYSSILDPGQHVVHEVLQGRKVWLHIVCGKAIVNGINMTSGDGLGITKEPSVSLTVQENTELLLIDMISNDS